MSEQETSDTEKTSHTPPNFLMEFAAQFAEFLKQSLRIPDSSAHKPPNHDQLESFGEISIKAKLNGENYPLWVNLMKRAIAGKGLTSHINGVSKPPAIDDPSYTRWEQRDNCVFNWVINNIETGLVNEVSQYATAADLWEGLAITYGSGSDPFQIYDLHRQAMTIKQESMTLEGLWIKMQDLWISIDTRDPSPTDIEGYQKREERHRLYQFLSALDDKYANIKREIMDKDPLPTVRRAYGLVRRQAINEDILKSSESPTVGIGSGLAAVNHSRPPPLSNRPQQGNQTWNNRKGEIDKSKLVCTHCGGKKHTKEGCFLLIGFPEWWDEMKKSRAASKNRNQPWSPNGQATVAVSGTRPTSIVSAATTGGAWSGGDTRAANAGTPAGNVGPPPPQTRINEERGGALAARVHEGEGYEDGEDSWAWH
ncbi:uncharacterized protein LOC131002403 [Salvia miltiorrhiza]|uniref:uncharacterized protein LOC131002403 n=1 Tax=Salvia miltiorrhiza TaxID=226208 RepID=UPI0025AC81DF|nr:uncharacterized protein LOC131002403 [Salvia miltiorrhiza]